MHVLAAHDGPQHDTGTDKNYKLDRHFSKQILLLDLLLQRFLGWRLNGLGDVNGDEPSTDQGGQACAGIASGFRSRGALSGTACRHSPPAHTSAADTRR